LNTTYMGHPMMYVVIVLDAWKNPKQGELKVDLNFIR